MSRGDRWASVQQRLRTVRGQFELIGLFLVIAVLLAGGLATQGAWFRSLVHEDVGDVSPQDATRIASVLHSPDPRTVPPEQLDAAYRAALRAPEPPPDLEALGAALDAARPLWVRERLKRTLMAGNAAQRARAARLTVGTGNVDYLPVLRAARGYAERTGFHDALPALDQAIDTLSGAPVHL